MKAGNQSASANRSETTSGSEATGDRAAIANDILTLLHQRDPGKTICPSEVLPPSSKKNKNAMEEVRQVAFQLMKQGRIEVVQKGKPVDPENFRGPLRLRLKSK